ncbi:MAG: hypothetical protein RLZZ58_674 [Pseudomonadota bacterium]
MSIRYLASTALCLFAVTPAFAQSGEQVDSDDMHSADDIVVTAPYVRSLDVLGNVSVIEGDKLAQDVRAQIGDSLTRQPGVSATSFSAGASRPVLRGFQGERVRILTDGIGSIDVSNTSADHAVTIDPLTSERIEILRGPAVLLFGSQAIGGAVNVFDRRIARKMPEAPLHIDAIAGFGSAADDISGGASVDVPIGTMVTIHADGSYRNSGDVRIGGFTLTPGLRAEILGRADDARRGGDIAAANGLTAAANQRGRIPNSATETWTAAAGASIINEGGQLGFSISRYVSDYGIASRPGSTEDAVAIGLKQWRADVRGKVELGDGAFSELRVRGGFADYSHTEFEGGNVGTTFLNTGVEGRIELVQNDNGGWRGASGFQYFHRDFNAVGAEAFVPANLTSQWGAFTLQELTLGSVSLEGALRVENSGVKAASVGVERRFTGVSGALGISYALGEDAKISASVSRAVRAPSAEELFSNGPHVATQSYEIGDATFGTEKSVGLETSIKLNSDGYALGLTGYANAFDGFIYEAETGAIIDDLPVFQYRQAKARYVGFEAEASLRIAQFGGYNLVADVVGDYTNARIKNVGPAPRIPALRALGGLELQGDRLDIRAEVEWTDRQARVAAFESPTGGFTIVNASASWHPLSNRDDLTLSLAANNIFDVVARRHASFTKDYVPLAGRDIRLTARVSF